MHPRFGTPGFAIWAQGAWSAVLLLTGSYESLIDYALFGIWVFYGLMVVAVIVLRRTRPDLPRPYRMWGYPVTTLLGLMLTGVPAYIVWQRYRPRPLHGFGAAQSGSMEARLP